MSVPSTEEVTGAPVSDATDKAIEDADKQAETNPAVPTPDPPKDAPTPEAKTDDGLEEVKAQLATLGETVNTLTGLVESVVSQGSPDEGAGSKLPLLLRGKRGLPE